MDWLKGRQCRGMGLRTDAGRGGCTRFDALDLSGNGFMFCWAKG